jgi:hypothetical protein
MACLKDRYAATYVVAPDLGPTNCQVADFTDIQSAINALPPSGGKIFVKAGTYPISKTIRIMQSNVQIQGEGMGITNIVADKTMTNSPAVEAYDPHAGNPLPLVADTARGGDPFLKLNPLDAAILAPDDDILLFSNKSVDSEVSAKHAGEIKRVVAVNKQTGVITVDDQIYDAYLVADSAEVARITMLRNVMLSDFSVTTTALSNAFSTFTLFRFIDNLQIERVESHHADNSGMALVSVLNSHVADCYIHHIRDLGRGPTNFGYGIVVGSASQNVTVSGCRFSHTRHAVTTGGSSGSLQNGVQRNISVSNCTSVAADTAHFDTHDPAENVSYIGCVASGGLPAPPPAPQVVVGFQMRAPNSSIVGCSVLQAFGKGIMIFNARSNGATITGNRIAGVKSSGGTLGVGIFFDSSGTSRHAVTGNVITGCEGSAIRGADKNNDVMVSANLIDGTNTLVPGASITFDNAARATITGNKIINNQNGRPIEMAGASKNWYIAGNSFDQNSNNSPAPLSVDATVINNPGYNPVGIITNPWHPNGDLTNEGGGGPEPDQRTTLYGQTKPEDHHPQRRQRNADRDRWSFDRHFVRGVQIGNRRNNCSYLYFSAHE